MRRVTITLPDDMAAAPDREARRQATCASAVVREALAGRSPSTGRPGAASSVHTFGRSGGRDTARRVDPILDAEWDAEVDGGVPR